MKKNILRIGIIVLAFSIASPVWGQGGLEESLRDMFESNAKLYVAPLATAFGTGLNSGTYRTAKPHKILGFDVTINLTLITIPDAAKEYTYVMSDRPFGLDVPSPIPGDDPLTIAIAFSDLYESGHLAPTFFGSPDLTVIPVNNTGAKAAAIGAVATQTGLSTSEVEIAIGDEITTLISNLPPFTIPVGGTDLPIWATMMPQFAIGLPFSTELILRGGTIKTDEGDEIKFGGFGIKVGLNQFIPTIPLVFPALSVGYYSTSLDLAGALKAKNSILTLQASKSIPILTVYGGFGIEKSSVSINIDDPDTGENLLDFSVDGDNGFRTTVGFRLKLFLLSLNVDYNIGEYSAVNAGIGLTFR